MATQPPSSDHDETVILKAPVGGVPPAHFDSDKTVVHRTPPPAPQAPATPKPKGFSISFDHPEANDLEATVKVAPLRDMPSTSGSAEQLPKRKPGAPMPTGSTALPVNGDAPAKGGMLKWILGGAAAIVTIILGVAYLLGANELAAPKVTILKQGTLIEPASTAALPVPASPAAPAAPTAPAMPAAPAVVAPEPPAAQSPAPALAVVPTPAPTPPPAMAAAPAAPTAAQTPAAAPKAPPDAKALAAAAAKKAALEKERLAKQAQAAPVVVQAPPPPVQAAPAPPPPPPVAAPKVEAPPAPVAPPPPAAPSNPNQACEGRLLFALQSCLTEQCAKPSFTKHAVCVERREMEQRRLDQQQSR